MKKNLLTAIMLLSTIALTAQINIISTSFYSQALDVTKMVNVFLPPGYDANPDLHYPVIYFLHGWQGNQNSGNPEMNTAYTMINQGLIDPVIIVCAHNSPAPFGGSVYTNSILWGDYETYMTEDLCNWVESTYRAMPGKQYRAVFGMSMGGYGAFRYGILHNDKYCALAACAAPVSFLEDNMRTQFRQMILQANQPGPPYTYNFTTGGPFTQIYFLYYGAFVPNYNTPQTYINPAILEFPLDENGNYIDTILAKVIPHDIASLINQLTPESSPGIYFGCGTNDPFFLYPGNLDVKDSLDLYSIPYTFYSHGGGHTMPAEFTENAFMFLDSLLMPPVIPCSCLPQGITFSNQAQIDNFQTNYPGCTEIEGNVTINGSNITNLHGLSVITYIGGDLTIGGGDFSNPLLTSLTGLENLTSIGDFVFGFGFGNLEIIGNQSLTNLTGLEGLISIGGDLKIGDWGYMASYGNPLLTSLTGLESLTSIGGSVEIVDNYSLINLAGLDDLTSIGGGVWIIFNNALTSLTGPGNLTTIGGGLRISENNALTSLTGLDNLTSLGGYFWIEYTNSLANLAGLDKLANIGGDLRIKSNHALTSLTGLGNLNTIGGGLYIGKWDNYYSGGNPALINLSGLDSLTSIGGDLRISSNNALTSLTGLGNLNTIGGGLYIGKWDNNSGGNPALISLSGLENLTSISGDLRISSNSALTSLTGLESLASINGSLIITSSHALTSIAGLVNLAFIGGNLTIGGHSSAGNVSLTSLQGLENLGYIGGGFTLYTNPALAALTQMENLTSIGGELKILWSALTSLEGLQNLTSIGGSLIIGWNNSLTSLTGLDNILAASITNLEIKNNSALSTCHVQSICDYLVPPNGAVIIQNNAPGCNSPEEVIAACEATSIEETIAESGFFISPNPFSGQLTIKFNLPQTSTVSIQIFNAMGAKVAELHQGTLPAGQQQFTWHADDLPKGLYLYRVQTENETSTQKIIKVQ